MNRAFVSLALVAALGSCEFAQKHPAVTVGLVSGTIGFGMCGLNVEKLGTCGAIGGGIGVVLGGITGLVTLLGNTNAEPLPEEQEGAIESVTEPPPGLPAGAGVAPTAAPPGLPPGLPADAGVAPTAAPPDAGMPIVDAM